MSRDEVLGDLARYLVYCREEGERGVELSTETHRRLFPPVTPPRKEAAPRSAAAAPERTALRAPAARPPAEAAAAKRAPAGGASAPQPVSAAAGGVEEKPGVEEKLQVIARAVSGCTKCSLHKTRTKTVPGQGALRPEIAFVGEAPGADEDEQGLAFVGAAGQLLTKMITAMGYRREEVWIGNILKCRPPGNRPPLPEEMETCIPYLKEQLSLIRPKVIVALGATAVKGLLGLTTGISKLRGTWMNFEGIELMPTYHPAYLLRNPAAKHEVWKDLQAVLARLGRPVPPLKRG